MRLTLRTMLAHLDGILEPEDHRELSTKIDESEFAIGLMHRIRQCTTRMRLGAPQIEGRSGGLDPNTVADYLDNTLPAERAPDFEKVCLESDMHLAEVAACHHILTMVLGEPARIDPASRNRMYDLPKLAEDGKPGGAAATTTESVAESNGTSPTEEPTSRNRPQVPDYLRDSQKRPTWMIVAGVLVASLLCFVAWDNQSLFVATAETASPSGDDLADDDLADGDLASDTAGSLQERVFPESPDRNPSSDDVVQNSAPMAEAQNNVEARNNNGETAEPSNAGRTIDSAPGPDAGVVVPRTDIDQDLLPIPPRDSGDGLATEPTPAAPGRGATAEPIAAVVGRYIADGVLLRLDRKAGQWIRLANNTSLSIGDRLVSLPMSRPKIVLGAGVNFELAGGTIVELFATPQASSTALQIVHGRLVDVMASGGAARLQLLLGKRQATIIFDDANTIIAVDHYLYQAMGTDPETTPGKPVTDLYVTSGSVRWIDAKSKTPERIAAGQRRTWMSGTLGKLKSIEAMPKWVFAEQATATEERGAFVLNKQLRIGQPASLVMKELINHRKSEVRSLSAQCHGFVDQFKALVDAIGDEQMGWSWRVRYIDSLRASVMRSRLSATQVRETLAQKYGDQSGMALYQMLYGYSPQQLKTGKAAQLVGFLSHEKVHHRAMAFYNLARITGIPLNYKPEVPEIRRRQSTRRWDAKLNDGEIVYKNPPTAPDVDPLRRNRKVADSTAAGN